MSEHPDLTPPPPPRPASGRSFGERLLGALKLDAAVYDEVEHDPAAMGQAAGVIALGALAEGLGALSVGGAGGLLGGIVSAFLGWLLSAAIIWLIGVKVMDHTSDYPELLRTLGFASAPKLLLAIGILPIGPLRPLLFFAVGIVTLVAFVIAVRQALDVSTGRAVWVCVLAVGVSLVLAFLLGGILAL
jgi:hypothetical protein